MVAGRSCMRCISAHFLDAGMQRRRSPRLILLVSKLDRREGRGDSLVAERSSGLADGGAK